MNYRKSPAVRRALFFRRIAGRIELRIKGEGIMRGDAYAKGNNTGQVKMGPRIDPRPINDPERIRPDHQIAQQGKTERGIFDDQKDPPREAYTKIIHSIPLNSFHNSIRIYE